MSDPYDKCEKFCADCRKPWTDKCLQENHDGPYDRGSWYAGARVERGKADADAKRYCRLAWLVEAGSWSVGRHEVIDSYGLTEDEYMDDKADMDKQLDDPKVIREAGGWEKAFLRRGTRDGRTNPSEDPRA